MRDVLVVAAREIAERKRIFAAAAFAGLLPFLAPLFPNIARGDVPQVRAIFAMIFLVSFGIGTAVVLGSTILVRDFVERRAGFYFARPLPSLAIWGGKILAALLLAAGAALLCAFPAWIVSPRSSVLSGLFIGPISPILAAFGAAGLLFGGLLFFVVLFHAAAVAIRSRSPWLIVDIVLLVASGILLGRSWLSLARVHYAGAVELMKWGVPILLVALLVSGAVQVSAGRTDLRRGHGAQSLTLWGVLLPLTLAGAGLAFWLLHPSPADIFPIRSGSPAPAGDWLAIQGRVRHRGEAWATFLLDAKTGSSLRTSLGWNWWWEEPLFSRDGRDAFWFAYDPEGPHEWSQRLWRADLSEVPARPRATTISGGGQISFSPSGRKIAILDPSISSLNDSANLSIVDLASEKTVAAVRVPTESRDFFFADEDTIRIYRSYFSASWASAIPLLEFRILERKLERTGEVPVGPGGRLEIRYEPGGALLFALQDQGRKLTLRDGRTGSLISTLSEGSRLVDFARISEAAIVALVFDGGGLLLKRLTLDGKILGTLSLGRGSAARLAGMSSDGHLLVNVCRSKSRVHEPWQKGWSLVTIDADSDRILSETPGLAPFAFWFHPIAPEPTRMRRGAPETKYFTDENGALVFFDPATGERKQILPRPR